MKDEQKKDNLCIYCQDSATRIRDGDHVLPEAIGGALTIVEKSGRRVCHRCNNGVLSLVDNELCRRSYLALIASQEINASLWQVWDVDQVSGGQLIEARPYWLDGQLSGLVCYPQIIFRHDGPVIWGDDAETSKFGHENFEIVLFKAVYGAFERYNAGVKRKSLFFEQLDSGILSRGYRYDPRVYTRHTISEIAGNIKKQSFVVRYMAPSDQRLVLRHLSNLEPRRRFKRWIKKPGTRLPPIESLFDLGMTLRGLTKIGLNILATYCTKTPVSRETFSGAVRLILGKNHPTPMLIASNGFVHAQDLVALNADKSGHAFRLTHLDGQWRFYASFFGGRLGAYVSFPGPNREDWQTLDVIAPLYSKDWRVTTSSLIQPIKVHVEWSDLNRIAPTLKWQNSYTELSAEEVALNAGKQTG